jgi:hypothetical protein
MVSITLEHIIGRTCRYSMIVLDQYMVYLLPVITKIQVQHLNFNLLTTPSGLQWLLIFGAFSKFRFTQSYLI